MNKKLILAIILLITFLVFSPSLKNDFVNWDDSVHLIGNTTLHSLSLRHLYDIFESRINTIYIPLTLLSFAIEHHFVGLNPFLYHLDNLLLHLGVTTLVFFFFVRLGLPARAAALGVLLFSIHPMRVESVVWVTERKDVLYAFFYMLALLAYQEHLTQVSRPGNIIKRYRYLAAVTILGAFSMLAKPMALSLPLILGLCDWYTRRRWNYRVIIEKIPLLLVVAAIGWQTYQYQYRLPHFDWAPAALVWVWGFVFYLRQFIFFPFSVPIIRLSMPFDFANPEYFLSVAAFVLIAWVAFRLRHNRVFVFGAAFYFLSLFFLLRFDDSDINIVADRFTYLPSLGISFWLASWIKNQKQLAPGVILVLFGLYSFLTVRTIEQSRIWQNSLKLWTHQLAFFPDEPLGINNFANTYKATGNLYAYLEQQHDKKSLEPRFARQFEYLVSLYKKSAALPPHYRDPYFNLGVLYQQVGKNEEATAYFKRILEVYPYDTLSYFHLGQIYRQTHADVEAVKAFAQAIRFGPDAEMLYIQTIQEYSHSLEADPGNAVYKLARSKVFAAYRNLAKDTRVATYILFEQYYRSRNNDRKAVYYFQKAMDVNPGFMEVLAQMDKWE